MNGRIKTYVKGLDAHLSGGIPAGSVVLVGGKPGSMKSSLAFNIIYHNAKEGHNCAYITLEQSRDSLLEHMKALSMDTQGLEMRLNVVDLGMIRKKVSELGTQTFFDIFKMYVENLKKSMDISIMVVDSMQVLEVLGKFNEPRDDFFKLFEWLRDLNLTTMVIAEMDQDSYKFCKHGESFLSDGIIHLDMRREDRVVKLYLSVIKMRKTSHRRDYFPLIFDRNGFEIVTG